MTLWGWLCRIFGRTLFTHNQVCTWPYLILSHWLHPGPSPVIGLPPNYKYRSGPLSWIYFRTSWLTPNQPNSHIYIWGEHLQIMTFGGGRQNNSNLDPASQNSTLVTRTNFSSCKQNSPSILLFKTSSNKWLKNQPEMLISHKYHFDDSRCTDGPISPFFKDHTIHHGRLNTKYCILQIAGENR